MSTKQNVFTQEQIMQLLDKMYEQCLHGIPKVSPPISELANNYLEKNDNVYSAASSFINYQIAKCTTSGFVTGLGGLITLPVTIPANISSVIYVQMRMIACIAYMGGYDINSDQVQTLVYACLRLYGWNCCGSNSKTSWHPIWKQIRNLHGQQNSRERSDENKSESRVSFYNKIRQQRYYQPWQSRSHCWRRNQWRSGLR